MTDPKMFFRYGHQMLLHSSLIHDLQSLKNTLTEINHCHIHFLLILPKMYPVCGCAAYYYHSAKRNVDIRVKTILPQDAHLWSVTSDDYFWSSEKQWEQYRHLS